MGVETCVAAEFCLLRIDKDELQVRRALGVKQRRNQDVEADGLTLSGCTADQKVRGSRQVEDLHFTSDLPADGYRQLCPALKELGAFHELPDADGGTLPVRHLEAHAVLQEGGEHLTGLQRHGDIIRKVPDSRDLHPFGREDLVEGHGRAGHGLDIGHLDVMVGEGLPDDGDISFYLSLGDCLLVGTAVLEEPCRRDLVSGDLINRGRRRGRSGSFTGLLDCLCRRLPGRRLDGLFLLDVPYDRLFFDDLLDVGFVDKEARRSDDSVHQRKTCPDKQQGGRNPESHELTTARDIS